MRPSALGRSTGSLPPAGKCPALALKPCLGQAVTYLVHWAGLPFLRACLEGVQLVHKLDLNHYMCDAPSKPVWKELACIVCS